MLNKIKIFLENQKVWMHIVKQIIIALVVLTVVSLIDMKVVPYAEFIPKFFLINQSLSKLILSTLAGALLTVTTFTFSTIMVVLTTYSNSYSPRIVENFLSEKSTMKVFGVFIGGFIYCILSLFFMREHIDYDMMSAGVGILYALYCMVQFIIFIFLVANAIQPQRLIFNLTQGAQSIIDAYIENHSVFDRTDTYPVADFERVYDVNIEGDGFLEGIDKKVIESALQDKKYVFFMTVRFGDFLTDKQNIAKLYYNADLTLDDDIKNKISKAFTTTDRRYAIEDYRFAVQKIVEVALRATSPGINDPYTAINCIQSLGLLLAKISVVSGKYALTKYNEGEAQSVIIAEDYNFEKDLYFTFFQIVHYGKEDISVVVALLSALFTIKLRAIAANKKYIKETATYVYTSSIDYYNNPVDKKLIKEKYDLIMHEDEIIPDIEKDDKK
jgi:uncharacterized membrane protein